MSKTYPFRVSRADGWPLCPRCGDDELYCLQQSRDVTHDHKAPPCPEMRCYRCNWHGPDQRVCEADAAEGGQG